MNKNRKKNIVDKQMVDISILIATKNRPKELKLLIKKLELLVYELDWEKVQ